MPIKKFLKRTVSKAKKYVKKRYGLNKASSGIKYGQMANDVMMLKRMVNAEKKAYEIKSGLLLAGQVFGNNSATVCLDITPMIAQGVTSSTRNGTSVKLHSALYQFQIQQQSAATLSNKVIIEFWINKATALDELTARDYLFAPSTFTSVIDANSPRNQDRFSEFRLVRRIIKTIPTDSLTGEATQQTFDVPVKFNRGQGHHIRLAQTLSGTPVNDILNGQMFMTMRPAIGNTSAVASTKDIPITAPTTGLTVRFAYKTWYYDN